MCVGLLGNQADSLQQSRTIVHDHKAPLVTALIARGRMLYSSSFDENTVIDDIPCPPSIGVECARCLHRRLSSQPAKRSILSEKYLMHVADPSKSVTLRKRQSVWRSGTAKLSFYVMHEASHLRQNSKARPLSHATAKAACCYLLAIGFQRA